MYDSIFPSSDVIGEQGNDEKPRRNA